MAVITEIGDGANTIFGKGRWLLGHVLRTWPLGYILWCQKRANKRSVIEALTDHQWIADIQGALSVGAIAGFLKLWDYFL
jgi:hypothetical protein